MSYKKAVLVLMLIQAIELIGVVIYFSTITENPDTSNSETEVRLNAPPKFEDYAVKAGPNLNVVADLDFSGAKEVENYEDVFLDNKNNGTNVLANSYRIVSLPCQGDSNEVKTDCYTLWTYDSRTGHIMRVGGNHYFPTEVHLQSSLIKSGDEYYVVNDDSVRLIYVQ